MSGLLRRYVAYARAHSRSSAGVSPSYVVARTPETDTDCTTRSWSAASALVGDRYNTVAWRGPGTSATSRNSVSEGSRYARDLPDAVPVAMTTDRPACAWF